MVATSNNYPSLDIIRRSATNDPAPQIRSELEVAKLIDVSRSIGCKACQSACNEWNDLRQEVGINKGFIQNPPDLNAKTWTLMRFTEHETPGGDLERLIRKDGCMHCGDPGCLKACPSPGAIDEHEGLPDLGKYNAGQKGVYWSQVILIPILFVTGLLIWQVYFGHLTSVSVQRVALLIHALAAAFAITVIVVHI